MLTLLLAISTLATATTTTAAAPVVQVDAWGQDSVRVRIAPPGGSIVDPPLGALLIPHPDQQQQQQQQQQKSVSTASAAETAGSVKLVNGNLAVSVDSGSGALTATRVSDGKLLFASKSITFGPAAAGSAASAVSASLVLDVSDGAANKLYGLGEHRTGKLDMTGYSKLMQV